jgi:hypothetical protein
VAGQCPANTGFYEVEHEEAAMSCNDEKPITATECDPCNPGIRNHYFRGKLMTVTDYATEQRYMIRRRRDVTRVLSGYGIASGFWVKLHENTLHIGAGVGFDRHGRELFACDPVILKTTDDLVRLKVGQCGLTPDAAATSPGSYLLSAHYAERGIDGVRTTSDCNDDACINNHICETVTYSLRPEVGSGLPLRRKKCDVIEPQPGDMPKSGDYRADCAKATGHRRTGSLCCSDAVCDCPRPLSRLGQLSLDCDAGIALAYVTVTVNECGDLVFTELFQIIRDCELTSIQDVGWRNWHQRPDVIIARSAFASMFIAPNASDLPTPPVGDEYDEDDDDGGRRPQKPVKYPAIATRFWVCFSAPVQCSTLTRDVVSMTLVQPDRREAVGNVVRVPITGVYCKNTEPDDPPGTTRGFWFFVHYQFWQGEIQRGARSGFQSETEVEIRIDGNSIIDWAGRPVDGNAIARSLPSGNGTPGGEFFSSWRVRKGGEQLVCHHASAGTTATNSPAKPAPTKSSAKSK